MRIAINAREIAHFLPTILHYVGNEINDTVTSLVERSLFLDHLSKSLLFHICDGKDKANYP